MKRRTAASGLRRRVLAAKERIPQEFRGEPAQKHSQQRVRFHPTIQL